MIEIESSVWIARPRSEVFAVVADFSRNPEWQGGMRSCVWTSEAPHGVGSTYDQVAGFMGKTIHTSFEIVQWVEGERVQIRSTAGTFPIDVTRELIDEGDGCRVSARVKGEPGGLMGMMGPLMSRMVRRSVDGDYKRLKVMLES